MDAKTETGAVEVREGRFGLKLPEIREGRLTSFDVMHYFRDLWELNGYPKLSGKQTHRDEFVVSPTAEKPLLVFRRGYVVSSSDVHVRMSEGYNRIYRDGYYTYQVLSLPAADQIGPFANLISVSFENTHGSGHPNAFPLPQVQSGDRVDPMHWMQYGDEENLSEAYRELLNAFTDVAS